MQPQRSHSSKSSYRTSAAGDEGQDISLEKTKAQDEKNNGDSSKPPPASKNHPKLHNLLSDAVAATNPAIRHLASASSLGSQNGRTSNLAPTHTVSGFRLLSTTFEEQRYDGKQNVKYASTTRVWDPIAANPERTGSGISGHQTFASSAERNSTIYGSGSENATLFSRPDSSPVDGCEMGGKDKEEETDANEVIYPEHLKLCILITGIALSVFLISLDRTIITTVSSR